MKRYFFTLMVTVVVLTFAAAVTFGQTVRKSVSVAEVTGTFKMQFTGKFRGNYNEVRIASIGQGKIRVAMDLTFPYLIENGEVTANEGGMDETFAINGDVAVYNNGACTMTIRFVRPGTIRVDQKGSDADCGFGNRVYATGTYHKTSSLKPAFEAN